MKNQTTIHSTTQDFLDIYDITNNIVLLKDGSASMVLSVNAMNFGLLAEQEQDAIIYTYAALLNSLNYPIQILTQSQTKDATVYLDLLKKQEEKASSQQKKQRIARYRAFVSQLIKERNVLDKKFYVVVSASSLEMGLLPIQTVLPGTKAPDVSTIEKTLFLERAQTILEPRRDHLLGQFNRIGLFARQMATQEIIQVFYNNYNPEAAEGQQITDSTNYTTPLVKASTNGGFMNTQPAQSTAPAPTPAPTQPAQAPAQPAPAPTSPGTASQPTAPATTPAAAPAPTPGSAPTAPTSSNPASNDITETITPLNIPQQNGAEQPAMTTPGTSIPDATATTPDTAPTAPAAQTTMNTPTVSAAPSPAMAPSAPTEPATDPATSQQTDAEKKAQDAINSTLKDISPGASTPASTGTPATPPPTVNPAPVVGDTNAKPADTTNSMPPLPEI